MIFFLNYEQKLCTQIVTVRKVIFLGFGTDNVMHAYHFFVFGICNVIHHNSDITL